MAAFIAGSPDVAAFITRAHGAASEKVAVVPTDADPVGCPPRSTAVSVRSTPWRIGGAGRLVHQEGFDVLIDAAAHLSGRHDVELVIAGEGEMRRDLERRATGLPVRFIGSLNTPADMTDFLHSLDVFACPLRHNGRPRALLDALACRLPVVATNIPPIRSVVGPDLDLVPIDDSRALAAALEAHKGAWSERPRSVATFDDAARAHAHVFSSVLDRHPSRVAATRPHGAIETVSP
jgi:glycosyltransferase involved in cell wall biosynthesis